MKSFISSSLIKGLSDLLGINLKLPIVIGLPLVFDINPFNPKVVKSFFHFKIIAASEILNSKQVTLKEKDFCQ